eukprot:PhM_4_TR12448/c0_g1_i1/m.83244
MTSGSDVDRGTRLHVPSGRRRQIPNLSFGLSARRCRYRRVHHHHLFFLLFLIARSARRAERLLWDCGGRETNNAVRQRGGFDGRELRCVPVACRVHRRHRHTAAVRVDRRRGLHGDPVPDPTVGAEQFEVREHRRGQRVPVGLNVRPRDIIGGRALRVLCLLLVRRDIVKYHAVRGREVREHVLGRGTETKSLGIRDNVYRRQAPVVAAARHGCELEILREDNNVDCVPRTNRGVEPSDECPQHVQQVGGCAQPVGRGGGIIRADTYDNVAGAAPTQRDPPVGGAHDADQPRQRDAPHNVSASDDI